jgi:hypothetical protein
MAYYDHSKAMHYQECADMYKKLKKHITSKQDGKINEWYLASLHMNELEKQIEAQKEQIKEYKDFFKLMQKLLPHVSSPHDVIG